MPEYCGKYTDKHGEIPIIVQNDFRELSFEAGKIRFSGTEFSDFSPCDKQISPKLLNRFSFLKSPIADSSDFRQTLCDCCIEIDMPILIVDFDTQYEHSVLLTMECILGKARTDFRGGLDSEFYKLRIHNQSREYFGEGQDFEEAFNNIILKSGHTIRFKNCFGCAFGEYNIAGHSSFGTMKCLFAYRNQFSKTISKHDFHEIFMQQKENVQEIFLCEEFKHKILLNSDLKYH